VNVGQIWKNLKNLAAYGFVITTGSTGRKKNWRDKIIFIMEQVNEGNHLSNNFKNVSGLSE
jgi:hypothetical protein